MHKEVSHEINNEINNEGGYDIVRQSWAAIARIFIIGACYQVISGRKAKNFNKENYVIQLANTADDDPERGYTFRYLGKEGIHHKFIEICGGWTRTYTDAQLVGKELIEVSEDAVKALLKSSMMSSVRF